MLKLNLDRVRENARKASTEDLLDRVTVYRGGMEPEALEVICEELYSRDVTETDIRAHEERRSGEVLWASEGVAEKCTFCDRPAVAQVWRWHRLWKLLPLFPRRVNLCERHAGPSSSPLPSGERGRG